MRPPLGSLDADEFLRKHWQKRPLLVREALPQSEPALRQRELFALACREDVESRLVRRHARRWEVRHGPFRPRELRELPDRNWTLLVQGVEAHLPAARALLDRFAFIPYARQDDLMVSIAPPGGGVGPHFDSYDVFLLQISGRRKWRLGARSDLRLVEDAPLKLLRNFRPEHETLAAPGDLLYLPPRYAHDGIAVSACITCSIGFRAPSTRELATGFLQWLPDELDCHGMYRDPDLRAPTRPARLGRAMIARAERMLSQVRWNRAMVERFLGAYLTEPKAQIWFTPPKPALGFAAFIARARRSGVRLSLKTRMLYGGRHVYINGECTEAPVQARAALYALADRRQVMPWKSANAWADRRLHAWYRDGYVELA